MPLRISAFSRSAVEGRAAESKARPSRTSALSALWPPSCTRAPAMRSWARVCAAAADPAPRLSANASALTDIPSRAGDRVVDGVVADGAELEAHFHLGAHRLPVQRRRPEMRGPQRLEHLVGQRLHRVG